jgi:preprotein translocase subunit Sec61beta
MAEKEKQYMPQSSAGLMRYNETDSKIKIKPHHVVVVSLVFASAIIVLKLFA